MSLSPIDDPPDATLNYFGSVAKPKLRGIAKVLAIIAIVSGSISLLGPLTLPQYFISSMPSDPSAQVVRGDRLLLSLTVGETSLEFIVGYFLLTGGIKSLKLNPRGRRILVNVSLVDGSTTIPSLIFFMCYSMPKFEAMAQRAGRQQWLTQVITDWFAVVISLLSLFFSCLVVYVFTRARVKAQFEQAKSPGT